MHAKFAVFVSAKFAMFLTRDASDAALRAHVVGVAERVASCIKTEANIMVNIRNRVYKMRLDNRHSIMFNSYTWFKTMDSKADNKQFSSSSTRAIVFL